MIEIPENDTTPDAERIEGFVSQLLKTLKGCHSAWLYVKDSGITEKEAREIAYMFIAKKYHVALKFLVGPGFNQLIISKSPIPDSNGRMTTTEILN